MRMPWDMPWTNSDAGQKFEAEQNKRLLRGIKRARREEASWTQEKRDTYVVFKKATIASFIVFGLATILTMNYVLVFLVLAAQLLIAVIFLIIGYLRRNKTRFPICYKTPLMAFGACVLIVAANIGGIWLDNKLNAMAVRKAEAQSIKDNAETRKMMEDIDKMLGTYNKKEANNE